MSFPLLFNRHLGSQLAEMEKLIDKMLQADFSKCITLDLNRPVSDTQLLAEEVWAASHFSVLLIIGISFE